MFRRPLLLLAALFLLAGCGGTTTTTGTPPSSCVSKYPPQSGETERLALCAEGRQSAVAPAPVGSAIHVQGIDISRWQPHPRFAQLHREGIRFVIIQTNAGACACNPFFYSQVREARSAGLRIGVYVFVEPGASTAAQAGLLLRVAAPVRREITLGAWVDAEVPGAYQLACPVVSSLSRSFYHHGPYSGVGLWPGYHCFGQNWPAKWGGLLQPLPGYSRASIAMRQWCGTCYLGGNDGQIDRDEWLSALPGKPQPKPSRRVLLARLAVLRADLARHHCWSPNGGTGAYRHACAVWKQHDAEVKKALA